MVDLKLWNNLIKAELALINDRFGDESSRC